MSREETGRHFSVTLDEIDTKNDTEPEVLFLMNITGSICPFFLGICCRSDQNNKSRTLHLVSPVKMHKEHVCKGSFKILATENQLEAATLAHNE